MDDGKVLRLMKDLVYDFKIINKDQLLKLTKVDMERAKQLLRLLLIDQKVFEVGNGSYIAKAPNEKPNEQIDKSLAAVIMMLPLIDPFTISADLSEDLILTFILNDLIYEVLCCKSGQKRSRRLEPDTGYVITLDSLEEANSIDIGLCDSVIFAVIDQEYNVKLYEVR